MPLSVLVDLRAMFGAPRSQGSRETCLSFAVSDTHAALRVGWVPLSCEYLHYQTQKAAGRPHYEGASIDFMLPALRSEGQPEESGWPYVTGPIHSKSWKPPASVGPVFKRDGNPNTPYVFDTIIQSLDKSVPIIAHLFLSDSFDEPKDGIVKAPASEMPDKSLRHAVVAVAHGTLDGERVVLVRNSWGPEWGDNGHAWLTESFLKPRIRRLTILTGEL